MYCTPYPTTKSHKRCWHSIILGTNIYVYVCMHVCSVYIYHICMYIMYIYVMYINDSFKPCMNLSYIAQLDRPAIFLVLSQLCLTRYGCNVANHHPPRSHFPTINPCHAIGGTFKLTSTYTHTPHKQTNLVLNLCLFLELGSQSSQGYTDLVNRENVKLRIVHTCISQKKKKKKNGDSRKRKKKPCISPPTAETCLSCRGNKIRLNGETSFEAALPSSWSTPSPTSPPPTKLSPHDSFLCCVSYKEEIELTRLPKKTKKIE